MPLLLTKQIDPFSAYAIWRISETTPQLKEKISENIPEMVQSKQSEWIVSRILVSYLCALFDLPYVRVDNHETGKPFLPGQTAEISISHSFPMAAALINLRKPCGIDLELPREKLLSVKSKFIHPSESFYPTEDIEMLCKIWSAKEVIYKMNGRKALSLRDDMRCEFVNDWQINGFKLSEKNPSPIRLEKVAGYILAYSY